MDTTWNPAMVAEAGLVPWAASGTRILVGHCPPGLVVFADEEQAGVLAMGAGGGLEGHAVHPGDLAQELLGGVQHFQGPLDGLHRLEGGWSWVKPGWAAASSLIRGLYFMVQEPRG